MHIENYSTAYPRKIGHLLSLSGVSPHLHGFPALCAALVLTARDGGTSRKIVTELYPEIAAMFGTTAYCIERNIRTAINFAWSSGALKYFLNKYGFYCEKRPSNAAFIARLAMLIEQGAGDSDDEDKAR